MFYSLSVVCTYNVQGGYGQQPPNRYGQPGGYGQQPPTAPGYGQPQGYQQPAGAQPGVCRFVFKNPVLQCIVVINVYKHFFYFSIKKTCFFQLFFIFPTFFIFKIRCTVSVKITVI